jgi:hypothetical protein
MRPWESVPGSGRAGIGGQWLSGRDGDHRQLRLAGLLDHVQDQHQAKAMRGPRMIATSSSSFDIKSEAVNRTG